MPERLVSHAGRTTDAVSMLRKSGHTESVLILLYSWIDRMAWLSVETEESNGRDFKRWVDRFLAPEMDLRCTSDELWAARCALLHTGSSESRDTNSGKARKLLYYGGEKAEITSNRQDTVFLKVDDLHVGILRAIGLFDDHLENNPHKRKVAEEKLGKILARTENV